MRARGCRQPCGAPKRHGDQDEALSLSPPRRCCSPAARRSPMRPTPGLAQDRPGRMAAGKGAELGGVQGRRRRRQGRRPAVLRSPTAKPPSRCPPLDGDLAEGRAGDGRRSRPRSRRDARSTTACRRSRPSPIRRHQPAVGGPLEEVAAADLTTAPASQNYPRLPPGPGRRQLHPALRAGRPHRAGELEPADRRPRRRTQVAMGGPDEPVDAARAGEIGEADGTSTGDERRRRRSTPGASRRDRRIDGRAPLDDALEPSGSFFAAEAPLRRGLPPSFGEPVAAAWRWSARAPAMIASTCSRSPSAVAMSDSHQVSDSHSSPSSRSATEMPRNASSASTQLSPSARVVCRRIRGILLEIAGADLARRLEQRRDRRHSILLSASAANTAFMICFCAT